MFSLDFIGSCPQILSLAPGSSAFDRFLFARATVKVVRVSSAIQLSTAYSHAFGREDGALMAYRGRREPATAAGYVHFLQAWRASRIMTPGKAAMTAVQ